MTRIPGLNPLKIAAVVALAKSRQLAGERYWHLLLHYVPTLLGFESEADGVGFFFATNGKTNPEAELEATLAALLSDYSGAIDDHPACRFPARYAWLSEQLGFPTLPFRPPPCPALNKWLRHMDVGGITLIYASAYLNAPASMYGHTLLRMDRRQNGNNPLLSNIVNYAASPTTDNPFLYTVLGLTGGFVGRFTAMPYYVKVQEYSNFESRDLWEYQLELSDRQILAVTYHVWEMEQTHFDYYYLTENCSYHLLSLIELARPDRDLRGAFRAYVIPADTVRAVLEVPELVRRRIYRPSQGTLLQARYRELSGDEVGLAWDLATRATADFSTIEGLTTERQARVLEAGHDLIRFQHGLDPSPTEGEKKWAAGRALDLLQQRSGLGMATDLPGVSEPAPPEEGHGTARLAVGVGLMETGRVFEVISYRFSLHDLLDRPQGYHDSSQIIFPEVRLRIEPQRFAKPNEQSAIILDRSEINVMSIQPAEGWIHMPSWRIKLGGGRVRDLGCRSWNCMGIELAGGPGYALGWRFLGRQILYGFVDLQAWAGPAFAPNYRVGADAAVGLLFGFGPYRMHAEARYRYDFLGDVRAGRDLLTFEVGQSLALHRDLAVRLTGFQEREYREATLSLHWHH
jgi:hypothetical protein